MAVQPGVQLPPDGAGKITGAFPTKASDGTTVWVGATVIVDANGNEIGGKLLAALEQLTETVSGLSDGADLAGILDGGV